MKDVFEIAVCDDSTFDRLKKADKSYRTVIVKHIDVETNEVIKQVSSHYIKGTTYRTHPHKGRAR